MGNLVRSLTVRRLQLAGHRLRALVGGATGVIGDPGETAERLGLTIPEVKRIEERAFSRIREVMPIKRLQRFL